MRILITGICGFVGSVIARKLLQSRDGIEIFGIDNFIRPGSETNRDGLKKLGITLFHGDLRAASDFECLPRMDYVIDAAANPSVLAGVDGRTSSRQLIEHNLQGTINLLEFCKRNTAGFILLSTSRVYSISSLTTLPVYSKDEAFRPDLSNRNVHGLSEQGLSEAYSTKPPISLYGASKLTSEALALEYGLTFEFPVWINRCGVLAGAGQFGRPDQGIFSFWIHSWYAKRRLKYIGFNGKGHQVRDCLHPQDIVSLLLQQIDYSGHEKERIQNLSGGVHSATSLRQLSRWCEDRFGGNEVMVDPVPRPFDIPWIVLDYGLAQQQWEWEPETPKEKIFEEIAQHAEQNVNWLDISEPL